MNKQTFQAAHPGVFFLDPTDLPATQQYLEDQGWLKPNEQLQSQTKAGEGNMNCTLRLKTSLRSVILKQARPWVEKYPQIPAPWDRAIQEGRFYQLLQQDTNLAQQMPRLLGCDEQARVLLMEDLGEGSDLSSLYQSQQLTPSQTRTLASFLADLHSLPSTPAQRSTLTNHAMRKLNHEHIFSLPLLPNNGIDLDSLTPGLKKASRDLLEQPNYTARVRDLGQRYLSDGETLLHGDFYPGSWLQQDDRLTILDPEFGFFGDGAFDLGVCLAHLLLSQQHAVNIKLFLKQYQTQHESDIDLTLGYAGVEIMRRLLGVAQLPLQADLAQKQQWLFLSRKLVLEPSLDLLESIDPP